MIRLKLYITAQTVGAERARAALRDVERRLRRRRGDTAITTEIIDVLAAPETAAADHVFATPTVVRCGPGPQLRLFGDLSSADKLIQGLKLDVAPPVALAEIA
jgi:hypothetical protein